MRGASIRCLSSLSDTPPAHLQASLPCLKVPVIYAFGHGLSYTEWQYSGLRVSAGPLSAAGAAGDHEVSVDVDVRNVGMYAALPSAPEHMLHCCPSPSAWPDCYEVAVGRMGREALPQTAACSQTQGITALPGLSCTTGCYDSACYGSACYDSAFTL